MRSYAGHRSCFNDIILYCIVTHHEKSSFEFIKTLRKYILFGLRLANSKEIANASFINMFFLSHNRQDPKTLLKFHKIVGAEQCCYFSKVNPSAFLKIFLSNNVKPFR